MESFLSRVATLKCLLTFLACASTILGERVKDVNKIRLSVFLLAAGQILKGKVGWGQSKQRNSCSLKKIVFVDTGYWKGAPPLFAVSKDQLPRVSG